jgi:response regulator of citrate/malate metabolism
MEKYNCIMLVDDDPITNFINYVTLSKMKISSDIAITRNGEEALHYLDEFKTRYNRMPELIILDVLMPVMDGFEFLEKFEKICNPAFCKSKVIMLSTLFSQSDIKILNQRGYSLFLNKPLEKEKLLDMLEQRSMTAN